MIDKAAILSDVMRRAVALRQAGLPCNWSIKDEVAFQTGLATERERHDLIPELSLRFADERALIEAQVIADLSQEDGGEFRHSKAGHYIIVRRTDVIFRTTLREVHGIDLPEVTPMRAIVYGEGRNAVIVMEEDDPIDACIAELERHEQLPII